jgi:hypothetical protein
MANVNAPFGLRPVRRRDGQPMGLPRHYYIPAGDSNKYHIGDPVDIVGDSNDATVETLGGTWVPGSLSEIGHATLADGNYCTGVIVGFEAMTRDSAIYGAASTERVALVCDDPDVIFEVQDDGGGSALGADTVGLNAIMITGTGNDVTGQSGKMMDAGTGTAPSANASYMLMILGFANKRGNTLGEDYGIWEVMINMHRYRATGDGDGSLGIA